MTIADHARHRISWSQIARVGLCHQSVVYAKEHSTDLDISYASDIYSTFKIGHDTYPTSPYRFSPPGALRLKYNNLYP